MNQQYLGTAIDETYTSETMLSNKSDNSRDTILVNRSSKESTMTSSERNNIFRKRVPLKKSHTVGTSSEIFESFEDDVFMKKSDRSFKKMLTDILFKFRSRTEFENAMLAFDSRKNYDPRTGEMIKDDDIDITDSNICLHVLPGKLHRPREELMHLCITGGAAVPKLALNHKKFDSKNLNLVKLHRKFHKTQTKRRNAVIIPDLPIFKNVMSLEKSAAWGIKQSIRRTRQSIRKPSVNSFRHFGRISTSGLFQGNRGGLLHSQSCSCAVVAGPHLINLDPHVCSEDKISGEKNRRFTFKRANTMTSMVSKKNRINSMSSYNTRVPTTNSYNSDEAQKTKYSLRKRFSLQILSAK